MSDNASEDLIKWDRLAELLSDSCAEASDEDVKRALERNGLTLDEVSLQLSTIAEGAINAVLKQRLEDAKVAVSKPFVSPKIDDAERDALLNELRSLVANEGDADGLITIAARSGRNGLSVADLKSLVEDLRWVRDRNRDGK